MRCFVAAWPDTKTRDRLAKLTGELAARCDNTRTIRTENLHLTLAFIGTLTELTATRVAQACREIRVAPIVWRLETLVHFVRPCVLAASGRDVPALGLLADTARAVLDKLAIDYDRKPFLPHVTLLRKVANYDGECAFEPVIEWEIDNVALYRSTQGVGGVNYQIVE